MTQVAEEVMYRVTPQHEVLCAEDMAATITHAVPLLDVMLHHCG